MNPADIAGRGLSPKELPTCVLWYRATTSKQLMGDLPTHRVTPSRPFSVCGVDYAGPINILRYRGRGARTTKGYIALLRGAPKHIYCDNGTTFVGARRKLLEIFKFVSKLNENEQFCYFLSQVNIEWHFSPPVRLLPLPPEHTNDDKLFFAPVGYCPKNEVRFLEKVENGLSE
ncbi:integrase catalytic domain-containing protein [Trichonephila clavipes]|nr:integrase catalytic domain-containing protein [Trichonephila clavipes]